MDDGVIILYPTMFKAGGQRKIWFLANLNFLGMRWVFSKAETQWQLSSLVLYKRLVSILYDHIIILSKSVDRFSPYNDDRYRVLVGKPFLKAVWTFDFSDPAGKLCVVDPTIKKTYILFHWSLCAQRLQGEGSLPSADRSVFDDISLGKFTGRQECRLHSHYTIVRGLDWILTTRI